jgi:hypothetical protein
LPAASRAEDTPEPTDEPALDAEPITLSRTDDTAPFILPTRRWTTADGETFSPSALTSALNDARVCSI